MAKKHKDEALGMGAWVFALLSVLFAFVAVVVAGQAFSRSNDAKSAVAEASGTPVSLSEFKIDPSVIAVETGGSLTAKNAGKATHNLAVKGTGLKTADIAPGSSDRLDVSSLKSGMYTVYCQIPGHEASGMTAMLHVGIGGGTSAAAQTSASDNDRLDDAQKKPVDAYVAQLENGANTPGVGAQVLAPTVLPDGTKEFNLTAKITDWAVVTRKRRAGLDLQRNGPRARRSRCSRVTMCASCSTTNFRSRRPSTSTASRCPTPWTAFPTSPKIP